MRDGAGLAPDARHCTLGHAVLVLDDGHEARVGGQPPGGVSGQRRAVLEFAAPGRTVGARHRRVDVHVDELLLCGRRRARSPGEDGVGEADEGVGPTGVDEVVTLLMAGEGRVVLHEALPGGLDATRDGDRRPFVGALASTLR